MRFRATIVLGGKTATGIEVPADVVTRLGSSKRPAVLVTINEVSFRTTVAPMGGQFWIPVSAERRESAGVAAGDQVDVEIELDHEPRVVTVPADLAAALARDGDARREFDALSYTNQLRHVLSVEGAKTAETRERRVAKVVSSLGLSRS